MKKVFRLLALLFCIPLVCSFFMKKEEQQEENVAGRLTSTIGFRVEVTEVTGTFSYDPEELLPYTMASLLAGEEGKELERAAAIVCRTNLIYAWEREGKPVTLDFAKTGLTFCGRKVFRKMQNTDALLQAVRDTQGMVLTYEGEVIDAPFFYLSAGSTRNGAEVYGEGRFSYLQTKECINDLSRQEYLQQYFYQKKEFYQKLSQWITEPVSSLSDLELYRETSGYVHSVFYQKTKTMIPADEFCEAFGLCSPCFDWEERENGIMIQTKGIGHGLGFAVCQASFLAEQGYSYYDILTYFYSGIMPDKRYNVTQNLRSR